MAFDVSVFEGLGKEFNGSTPIKGIESAIFRLSKDMSDELRAYMLKNGMNATEVLGNSIGGLPVKVFDSGAEMKIEALSYFKFVDQGVDGVEIAHGSPFKFKSLKPFSMAGLDSLKLYAKSKPLPAIGDLDSLAYAMSVSIKKKGIKPHNIIDGAIKEGMLDRMAKSITAALGKATELTFIKSLEQWQSPK